MPTTDRSIHQLPWAIRSELARALSAIAYRVLDRHRLQRNVSRFMGDAFAYAEKRGTAADPGEIPKTILSFLLECKGSMPTDPMIIVSYSMGGAIVYDMITEFMPAADPRFFVDVWISVGSQVGHFEDMGLLLKKHPECGIGGPKVPKLKRVGRWFNVFDAIDPLAFAAEPVFEKVKDVDYVTGRSALTAHGAYFQQDAFYDLLHKLLREAFDDWRRDLGWR